MASRTRWNQAFCRLVIVFTGSRLMIPKTSAWSALWTFPSILISSFVIAWGAEAAQFLMSQGLAPQAMTNEEMRMLGNVQSARSEEHTSELQSHLNLVC